MPFGINGGVQLPKSIIGGISIGSAPIGGTLSDDYKVENGAPTDKLRDSQMEGVHYTTNGTTGENGTVEVRTLRSAPGVTSWETDDRPQVP